MALTSTDIRGYLLASTPISAAVVDRVYYDGLASPDPDTPYLLIRMISGDHTQGLAAIGGLRAVDVRIDAVSTDLAEAEALIELVRKRVVAMHGDDMGATRVLSSILVDSFFDVVPPVPGGRTTALPSLANVYKIGCAEAQPDDHEG